MQGGQVDVRVEGAHPGVVDLDRGLQEVGAAAVQDDADVDALAAVDPGDRPQQGVLEDLPAHGAHDPDAATRRSSWAT